MPSTSISKYFNQNHIKDSSFPWHKCHIRNKQTKKTVKGLLFKIKRNLKNTHQMIETVPSGALQKHFSIIKSK